MNYREQLKKAIDYAEEKGSFSKISMAENADIVCAWGLGKYFEEAFEKWDFKNIMHVNLLCDSEESKWGGVFSGLRCVSPDELIELNRNKSVLVIPFIGRPLRLEMNLRKNNIAFVNLQDCFFEMIANMERSKAWFHKNNILEVLSWLADEESRRVYTNVLCNRIAPPFSEYYYDSLYSPGEYFETDAFRMSEKECYIDCGAYNGDTIERFLEITEGRVGDIYAFEMDKDNYRELQENTMGLMKKYGLPSDVVNLYNAGVWDDNGTMPYGKEPLGPKESFSLLKTEVVDYTDLIKLDDLLKEKKVSMIKMDIEGAEYKALKGAKDTILKNKPKMAICLYHKLQDFWEIPTYIKTLIPEYKIYIRHHQKGTIGGTVMYAVS